VKNRMREIRSSGTVRGGDGDVPTYSAQGVPANIELAGIIADDDGLRQEAVCLDAAPEGALGGDPHRVLDEGQIRLDTRGDAKLVQMRLPRLPISEVRIGCLGQPGDQRSG